MCGHVFGIDHHWPEFVEEALELLDSVRQLADKGPIDVDHVKETVVPNDHFWIAAQHALCSIELCLVVVHVYEDRLSGNAVLSTFAKIQITDITTIQGLDDPSESYHIENC